MGAHSRPTNGLSLCAGAGGLDLGLMLAEPGFHTRCWVEWEDYPRRSIIAGQRAGYFAPAPIWDDVTTFDGRPFRGAIDTILAGYPCQPFSAAGQRKGDQDERHLWPEIARIIREVQPRWVFLENVAGHVSLGLETVLRDLWEMGWTPAAGIFSAGETGAPHERQRVFIVAHRDGSDGDGSGDRGSRRRPEPPNGSERMAHPDGGHPGAEREQRGREQRFQPESGGFGVRDVVHAQRAERGQESQGGHESDRDRPEWDQETGRLGKPDPALDHAAGARCDYAGCGTSADQQGRECLSGEGCGNMGHPARFGRGEGWSEHGLWRGRDTAASAGGALADTGGARAASGSAEQIRGQQRVSDQPIDYRGSVRLFPPGPGDSAAWSAVLAVAPHIAPAVSLGDVKRFADHCAQMVARGELAEAEAQSLVRLCSDGMANRSRSLRLLGNGVHPLAAAYAWRTLAAAHGLGPVDLEAAGGEFGVSTDTDGVDLT